MSKYVTLNEDNGELLVRYTNFSGDGGMMKMTRVEIDDNSFLKVKETLTRVGIYSSAEKTLWQSAHILHKKGFYYIVHFKELFAMDGRQVDISHDDSLRKDVIVGLLLKWNLIRIPPEDVEYESRVRSLTTGSDFPVKLRVVSYKNRRNVNLKSKYPIGKIEAEKLDVLNLHSVNANLGSIVTGSICLSKFPDSDDINLKGSEDES